MRAIWSGSLAFGLVSIDIKLFTAVREHAIGFKLLHNVCRHPISYKRWCNYCKKEVGLEDIVKGLELKKNTYFILSEENLKKLKLEKTDTIDVAEFVEQDLIDPIYYDRHYYALPGKADKAYFLFKKALEVTSKVALGTFVMRDREHLCAISSYEQVLLISILNYSYEIIPTKDLPTIKEVKITEPELALGKQLIAQLTKKKFDISEFKDTFAVRLREILKKGKKISAVKRKAIAPSAKEETLISALRASIGKTKTTTKAAKTTKKPALRAKSKK